MTCCCVLGIINRGFQNFYFWPNTWLIAVKVEIIYSKYFPPLTVAAVDGQSKKAGK